MFQLAAPLALIVLGVFLFVPAAIYSGNAGEFSAPFSRLLVRLLPAALGAFAAGLALALLLSYFVGERIAAILDIEVGAVKVRVHRAVKDLRAILEDQTWTAKRSATNLRRI